jgi:hypothetical protein
MAKIEYATPITADGTYFLGNVVKSRNYDVWKGLFYAYGTFGGGTVAWRWAPVAGSTAVLLPMADYTGAAITSTANDSFTSEFVTGSKNTDHIQLYAVVTGSAGASITLGFYDSH